MGVDKAGGFEAFFSGKLWKLKTEGDLMKAEDWLNRDFSIAMNGSLIYYSIREGKDLAYYTASDIASSTVSRFDGKCARRFVFNISLPDMGGVQFEPGVFAAESEEHLKQWFDAF